MFLSIVRLTLVAAAVPAFLLAQQTQQQQPPAKSEPQKKAGSAAPPPLKEPKAPRKFSFGVAIYFEGLRYMENGSTTTTLSTNTTFKSTNENLGNRFGVGPVAEYRFAKRWGVASGITFRTGDYRLTNDTTVSTTVSSVTTDKVTTVKERTSFHSFELPVLLRRFSKEHDDPGFRWFYQGGVSARRVSAVRSERSTTTPDGKVACCNETAAVPGHRVAVGFTAGAGITSRDQFGIRVTPEIRYTRWMQRNWDNLTARSTRDQVELVVGFTF